VKWTTSNGDGDMVDCRGVRVEMTGMEVTYSLLYHSYLHMWKKQALVIISTITSWTQQSTI